MAQANGEIVAPNLLNRLGHKTIRRLERLVYAAAMAFSIVLVSLGTQRWTRPVRKAFGREMLSSGYESTRIIVSAAFLVGISVTVQVYLLLRAFGQMHRLGAVLAMVIFREIAPILANLLIICRSGTAMATELGAMRVNGEVDLLDALGVDPFIYLVVTRVLGVVVSVCCLTAVFIMASFAGSFACGSLLGLVAGHPLVFIMDSCNAIARPDVIALVAKTLIPGFVTGIICCREGLSVGRFIEEAPRAGSRAVVRSTIALFLVSAAISLFMYL